MTDTENTPRYDSRWQYWSLVIMIYTCLVAMGVVENARSVTFPLIKEVFNVPYDQYGLFNSWLGVAYILFCLVASFVSEKVSYKILIMIGYVLITAGCLLTHFASSFLLAALIIFLIWMGFGFFEIGSNASSTLVFIEHQGTMMSLMHFFFGIGAVIGPVIAKWSLSTLGNSFYSVYFCLGIIVAVLGLISLFLPFKLPSTSRSAETSKSSMSTLKALATPSVWLCSFTMAMGQAVENSGASWAPLYLVDVLGFNIDTDVANFSTWLYAVFTLSRLVSGFVIDKIGYYTSLYISHVSCFVLLTIGFFLGRNGVVCFVLSSFFYSANWPLFICIIMGYYKEDAPVVTSITIVLQGVINLPITYLLGVLNEYVSKSLAYRLTLVFCVVGSLLLTWVYFSQKRREKELRVEAKANSSSEKVDVEKDGEKVSMEREVDNANSK